MNKHISTIFYPVLLLVSAVLAGCIKEKGSDYCPPSEAHYLIVRSFDADNNDITGTGAVRDVVLYVFDSNGAYINRIVAAENQRIPLAYPEGTRLKIVAWGNSGAGNEQMPALAPGSSVDNAAVTLLKKTSPVNYSLSPDDLFFASSDVFLTGAGEGEVDHPVSIKRKAASMTVTIKGLQQWAGTTDTDFSIVVNGTRESIDFTGKSSGNAVSYRPPLTLNGNGSFVTGIFNTFPSADTAVSIDIYKGPDKIYTVTSGNDGKPLVLSEGRLLNVLIDFTGGVSTTLSVTDWGKIDINQEF